MSPFWTTVLVAVAGPLGSAVILALSALAAAALAEKINPTPETPVEERVRRAVETQTETERAQARLKEAELGRRGESIDSTHVSFPVFGIVFAVMVLLQSWGAAASHIEDPGRGFPLALAIRPLWASLVAALIAGIAAGHFYRRRYRRLPLAERIAIEQRRRAGERRAFEDRLRSIRRGASRRSEHR